MKALGHRLEGQSRRPDICKAFAKPLDRHKVKREERQASAAKCRRKAGDHVKDEML
jgi:hypothetical protein